MNEKEIQRRLQAIADLQPSPEATARDLERVRQMLTETPNGQVLRRQNTWSKIMHSNITKTSAAVILLVAVVLGIHFFAYTGNSVAFADVVKPILEAKSAVMDVVIGPEGKQAKIHDEIMGSRIRRTTSDMPNDTDVIIDLKEMKMLVLVHKEKKAAFIKLQGLGKMFNYLEQLQDTIKRMQEQKGFQIQEKGLQKIDGHDYLVFVGEIGNNIITIFADPKTALPVRIEQKTPNMQIACENIQFDVPLDPSRFRIEVPKGYKVEKTSNIDFKKSSEKAFLESLRIWAEIIEGGHFPDSVNIEAVVKSGPKFGKALEKSKLSEQEQMDTAIRFGQGLVFIRFFQGEGKWHYAGKGVKFGDKTKPVFWYQPKKSKTWRVIYGDLSVKDVAPEDLPEVPKTEKVKTEKK